VWRGKIIDGRHRALACEELGIDVPTAEFAGDEWQALALVISMNAARRDLKPTQRAMVAAKIANGKWGGDRKSGNQSATLHLDQAARSLGVSVRLVKAARFVIENGSPEKEPESAVYFIEQAAKQLGVGKTLVKAARFVLVNGSPEDSRCVRAWRAERARRRDADPPTASSADWKSPGEFAEHRHLNQEGKRAVIRDQLLETPEISDRQIAAMLGVSHPTVAEIRREMEQRNELERFTSSIGADGKERPRHVARAPKTLIEEADEEGEQALLTSAKKARKKRRERKRGAQAIAEVIALPRGLYHAIVIDAVAHGDGRSRRALESGGPGLLVDSLGRAINRTRIVGRLDEHCLMRRACQDVDCQRAGGDLNVLMRPALNPIAYLAERRNVAT
jgi:DNA-binding Lrp family transcriptional regulator